MEHSIAISIALTNMIKTNKINKNNAIDLIKDIFKNIELELPNTNEKSKVDIVVEYVKQIAKGKDGILGTEDDMLPKHVIDDMEKMASTSIFLDIVHLCKDGIMDHKLDKGRLGMCCLKMV